MLFDTVTSLKAKRANCEEEFHHIFEEAFKHAEEIGTQLQVRRTSKKQVHRSNPIIHSLLQVLATLPVSVATAERTFSTLKRIKTWLRTTMNEDRLTVLALLASHRDIFIDINKVIDRFAHSGKRKLPFLLCKYE